jgi:hypothetical protein
MRVAYEQGPFGGAGGCGSTARLTTPCTPIWFRPALTGGQAAVVTSLQPLNESIVREQV